MTRPHLCLFLSRGVPLATWHKMGILEREIAIYRRLNEWFDISLVTSGGPEELAYQNVLGDIQILYNRWQIPANAYSILAPVLHQARLKQMTIYKTNQFDGGWTAVLAGKLHHKPVVARAGYLWAESNRQAGAAGLKADLMDKLQAFTIRQANHLVVTTAEMKAHLLKTYSVPSDRATVIPNYVETDLFRPEPDLPVEPRRICFIGRLHPVKNLDLLIQAASQLVDCHLLFIGQGPQRTELEQLAKQNRVDVQFAGALPHPSLPEQINRSAVFVLPSKFEGHPKALIEAMACGVPVLGTDVPGIRQVIQHGKTGWLCPPTAAGLQQALQHLLADSELRRALGQAGRAFALQAYGLDQIALRETAVLQQVHSSYSRS